MTPDFPCQNQRWICSSADQINDMRNCALFVDCSHCFSIEATCITVSQSRLNFIYLSEIMTGSFNYLSFGKAYSISVFSYVCAYFNWCATEGKRSRNLRKRKWSWGINEFAILAPVVHTLSNLECWDILFATFIIFWKWFN